MVMRIPVPISRKRPILTHTNEFTASLILVRFSRNCSIEIYAPDSCAFRAGCVGNIIKDMDKDRKLWNENVSQLQYLHYRLKDLKAEDREVTFSFFPTFS